MSNSEARVVLEPDTISEPIVGLCSGCMARCICRISRFNKIPKLAPLFVFTTKEKESLKFIHRRSMLGSKPSYIFARSANPAIV